MTSILQKALNTTVKQHNAMMKPHQRSDEDSLNALDKKTLDLICSLSHDTTSRSCGVNGALRQEIALLFWQACKKQLTQPIVTLFQRLRSLHSKGIGIINFGIYKKDLCNLALKYQQIDEEHQSLGNRLSQEQTTESR